MESSCGIDVKIQQSLLAKTDLICDTLTHFMPMVSFDTPRKYKKTFGFLFSGGVDRGQWHEMG